MPPRGEIFPCGKIFPDSLCLIRRRRRKKVPGGGGVFCPPAGGAGRFRPLGGASTFLSDQKGTKESPGAAHAQFTLCYRAVPGPPFTRMHETKADRQIRRGWKSDLALNFCAAAAVLNLERWPSDSLVNAPGLCPGVAGWGTLAQESLCPGPQRKVLPPQGAIAGAR